MFFLSHIRPSPSCVSYYSCSRWLSCAVWLQVLVDYDSHDLLTWLYSFCIRSYKILALISSHDLILLSCSRDRNIHVVSFHFTSMRYTDTFSVIISEQCSKTAVQLANSLFSFFVLSTCICWTLDTMRSSSFSASASHSIFVDWLFFFFFFRFLVLLCMSAFLLHGMHIFVLISGGLHLCFGCFSCSSNINDFLYCKIGCSYFRCKSLIHYFFLIMPSSAVFTVLFLLSHMFVSGNSMSCNLVGVRRFVLIRAVYLTH